VKRLIAAAFIALSLALVGVGGAQATDKPDKPDKDKMSKACHDLKKADKDAFKETYGPKKAMRNCKKGEEPDATETTPGEFKNAAEECRAHREADPEGFEEIYGTNGNKKNAFGKCVSKTASNKAEAREDAAEAKKSAAECKKQQAADPAKFAEQYKNLGQCVKAQKNG
jgi:hypothetical protein